MTQPLTLNAKDFCAFLGFWLAEGAISGNQVIVSQNSGDVAEEYKQLLDEGVITEEEFQAKKKQILEI